ncbi:MAG TPA: hypothetical protein VM510_17680 [Caulifigura sp.]|jgi:hypothetical protein|nr:hypothetical protein [Caulifigura sp.]
MNACCRNTPVNANPPGRVITAGPVSGLACGVLWILCPKCPACLAGYAAVFGGLSVSIPTAAALLAGVKGFCIASLAVGSGLLVWRGWRWFTR